MSLPEGFSFDDIRREMGNMKDTMAVLLEPWTEQCAHRATLLNILREELQEKGFEREEAMQIILHHGMFATYHKEDC